MPPIPQFVKTLDTMKEIHTAKNEDYSGVDNPNKMFNFDVAERVMNLFDSSRDKVFACMIGIKLGRLASLKNQNKLPNNESIADSMIDMANYVILWKVDAELRGRPIDHGRVAEMTVRESTGTLSNIK